MKDLQALDTEVSQAEIPAVRSDAIRERSECKTSARGDPGDAF